MGFLKKCPERFKIMASFKKSSYKELVDEEWNALRRHTKHCEICQKNSIIAWIITEQPEIKEMLKGIDLEDLKELGDRSCIELGYFPPLDYYKQKIEKPSSRIKKAVKIALIAIALLMVVIIKPDIRDTTGIVTITITVPVGEYVHLGYVLPNQKRPDNITLKDPDFLQYNSGRLR